MSKGMRNIEGDEEYPLRGAKIFALTADENRRQRLMDACKELGAEVTTHYDPDITHMVTDDPESQQTRMTLGRGKWVVGPDWVLKSKEAGRKLPESDFPVGLGAVEAEGEREMDVEDEVDVEK